MPLPVFEELFSVPDNAYVIGTMNPSDRSISLLNTPLRRRFGFIELLPDFSALGSPGSRAVLWSLGSTI